MKISSNTIVKVKVKVAILKLVNLKSFIVPTQMQIVITSDIIQFLFENHHPNNIPNPTKNPMISITLMCNLLAKVIYFFSHLAFVRNTASIKHRAMHIVPYIQLNTTKIIDSASRIIPKNMSAAPTIMIRSTTKINVKLIEKPKLSSDQAFEHVAVNAITITDKTISIIKPHSKEFIGSS